MESITVFTIFTIGFSIFSCALLMVIGFHKAPILLPTASAKVTMLLMLLSLAGLQLHHYFNLNNVYTLFDNPFYALTLFIATTSFYLFGRTFLQPETEGFRSFLFFTPFFLVWLLPIQAFIPLDFLLGTIYSILICRQVYQLRENRKFFQLEMGVIIGFIFNAALILIVGLSATILSEHIFVLIYSNLIGFSLLAMIYLQLRFPDLTQKAQEIVALRYASSTLKNLDTKELVAKLTALLKEQKIYKDSELSLATLANQLQISNHQLSELINSHHEQSFSQLIREYRVTDAKTQLIEQPKASVLSIGLDVGFSSQSNFYTAFKEITGETPGQFRKRLGVDEG